MGTKIAMMSTLPAFTWEISTLWNGREGPFYVPLYYMQQIWILLYKDLNTCSINKTAFEVVMGTILQSYFIGDILTQLEGAFHQVLKIWPLIL